MAAGPRAVLSLLAGRLFGVTGRTRTGFDQSHSLAPRLLRLRSPSSYQGLNLDLPHVGRMLYRLSYRTFHLPGALSPLSYPRRI